MKIRHLATKMVLTSVDAKTEIQCKKYLHFPDLPCTYRHAESYKGAGGCSSRGIKSDNLDQKTLF